MNGAETWLGAITILLSVIAWLISRMVNKWDDQFKILFAKMNEHERRWTEHIHAFHIHKDGK